MTRTRDGLEQLLDDVLHDENGRAAEAALRQACLAELGRRRRSRRLVRVVPLAAAALLLVALALFDRFTKVTPVAPPDGGSVAEAFPPWMARSAPLRPHMVVATAAAPPHFETVASAPLGEAAAAGPLPRDLFVAHQVSVAIVRGAERSLIELSDQELLASFPDAPRTLVALGRGRKELRFLRPADAALYIAHPGEPSR